MDSLTKIKLWSDRISAGIKFRDEKSSKHWDEFLSFLLGDQWDPGSIEYNQVNYKSVVNTTWDVLKTHLPALYMANPHLLVRAKMGVSADPGMIEDQQKAFEAFYNDLVSMMPVKEEAREALTDAIVFPYCCIKVGFYDVPMDTDSADTQANSVPNQTAYIKRMDPFDIVIDPLAKRINGGRWVAERFLRPYLDVKNDSTIPASIRKQIVPSLFPENLNEEVTPAGNPGPEPAGYISDDIRDREGWVAFWEVTTLEEGGRILTFVEKAHDSEVESEYVDLHHLIRDEVRPYKDYLDGLHYRCFSFNVVPNTLYGPSDIQSMMEPQRELNYVNSMRMDRVRQNKVVWLTKTLEVDGEKAREIEDATDGGIVGLENVQELERTMFPLQSVPVSQDWYAGESTLKDQIWSAAGLDRASLNQPSDETATASMQRGQQMSVRMMDRSLVWEEYLTWVFNAWAHIVYHESPLIAQDQALAILGPDGRQIPIRFKPSLCVFENRFTIKLETSNTFPITRQVEMQQWLSFVNLVQNNPFVNSRQLVLETAEKFRIPNIDRLVPPFNIPPELIQLMQQDPQFGQIVMQIAQEYMMRKQQEAEQQQQGSGQGGQTRVTDPNAFQKDENPANQTSATALQGGGGPNF